MNLPFDALTAALDAWLGQHIPNATRRDRVRRAVDCLDDLRSAPLAHGPRLELAKIFFCSSSLLGFGTLA